MEAKLQDAEVAVPWSINDVFISLGVLIIIILVGSLLSLVPFSSGRLASSSNPILAALVMTLTEGILLLLAWGLGVRKYSTSFDKLGFRAFDVPKSILLGVLWLIAIKVFTVIYGEMAMYVFHLKPPVEVSQGIPDIFGSGVFGFVLAVLVVSLVASVAEEAFFRGFVYSALRKRFGVWTGIFVSAIIFALFHARLWLFIPVAVMGAILAFLYEKEKSLGPSILVHALNNLLSVVIIYASKG